MGKMNVKEYTEDRRHQTEPIWANSTEKGFECPNCHNEVIIERFKAPDGTRPPKAGLLCKKCNKKWDVLR